MFVSSFLGRLLHIFFSRKSHFLAEEIWSQRYVGRGCYERRRKKKWRWSAQKAEKCVTLQPLKAATEGRRCGVPALLGCAEIIPAI